MKSGTVLIIGRPNVGKSTFVNNIIGTKVSITSPKPQTTRFPIRGVYAEERGDMVFVDTPGIFDKVHDTLSRQVNRETLKTLNHGFDVALYMVDHTRRRDMEEAKVLGLVRQIKKPVILVINKIDFQEKTYLAQYEFMKDEFKDVFQISALKQKHLKPLIDRLFELLPDSTQEETDNRLSETFTHPVLNMDSRIFISELIREKIFLMNGDEVPYTATVVIDEITPRNRDTTYIKARVLTTHIRYRKMLIGEGARKIKEIGAYARKEIELATKKHIFLDLTVEVDKHWQELYT
ncbi:MAG: GTPase Era [Candidatus Roizmanbacteria bacterium]